MSEEKKFKIGDEVQLKSGGPVMTVDSEAGVDGRMDCVWFDNKKLQRASFNPGALDAYTAPEFDLNFTE